MTADNEILERLRQLPTTAGLSEPTMQRIAAKATLHTVASGTILHHAREPISRLVFVVDGRLTLLVKGTDDQSHKVAYLGTGTQFGLLSLIDEVIAPAELVADVASEILAFAREDAIELVAQCPLWKRNLLNALGGNLRESLAGEKPKPRSGPVAIVHVSRQTRAVTRPVIEQLTRAGDSVTLLSDDPQRFDPSSGTHCVSLLNPRGQLRPIAELSGQVAERNLTDRVVVDTSIDVDPERIAEFLRPFERTYLLVKPGDEEKARQWSRRLQSDSTDESTSLRWVWCLSDDHRVAPQAMALPSAEDRAQVDRTLKLHLPSHSNERLAKQGIGRLVHDIRNMTIGVALGGGAARGMAHLGVLQALEEAGIVPDAISGTSAGAMVGIIYASGLTPSEAAVNFARDLTPSALERLFPGGQSLFLLRKYRGNQWDRMLRRHLHNWSLEQLPLPVTSVAVDLVSGRQMNTTRGDAVQAILDSINLPGLNPPICRNGMALVDGGILNTVPADLLVDQGCDFVIAVDVSAKLDDDFGGNHSGLSTEKMSVPGVFETAIRAMSVQHHHLLKIRSQVADFTIEPNVSKVDAADFQHAIEIAAIGKAAAESAMEPLLDQLRSLDAGLVPSSA